MYKLTVMNISRGTFEDSIFQDALLLELVLISFAFIETGVLWYLLRHTNQYHRNLSMIMEQMPNQYFVSLLARMFMIYKQLTVFDTTALLADRYFTFAVWLRNSLLFVALYFSPFPVFERCFATLFLNDYEIEKRRWISFSLSGALYLIALTSAQSFVFGSSLNREIQITAITAFNLLAFGLTFVLERYMRARYSRLRKSTSCGYTLRARAQLSENINSIVPFKAMCFSIALFACLCTLLLRLDEYTESQSIKNWMYMAFNFSCWSYGTFVPFFVLAYNPLWQKELRRLAEKFGCAFCFSNRVAPNTNANGETQLTRVKDTFGNNCFVDDKQHTDIYFSQLKASWNEIQLELTPEEVNRPAETKRDTRGNTKESMMTPRSIYRDTTRQNHREEFEEPRRNCKDHSN